MEIFGRAPAIAGGNAATGSSRYSFRSSSDIGTDAQKYENVLLSGIISPRKRSANWVTLSLERSGWAGIEWQSHCNPPRKRTTFDVSEPRPCRCLSRIGPWAVPKSQRQAVGLSYCGGSPGGGGVSCDSIQRLRPSARLRASVFSV